MNESTESQNAKILAHIKDKGRITPLDALSKYGCLRLAARVHDLRQAGHAISTEVRRVNGKRFAVYYMEQGNDT